MIRIGREALLAQKCRSKMINNSYVTSSARHIIRGLRLPVSLCRETRSRGNGNDQGLLSGHA